MRHRFLKAPDRFTGGAITLDNVVLAPANLLARKAQWQRVANSLPQGSVLVVRPRLSKQAAILEQVAEELRKIGRSVTTMPVEAHEATKSGSSAWETRRGWHAARRIRMRRWRPASRTRRG